MAALLLCVANAYAQTKIPAQILKTLRKDHPRLLVTSGKDFDDLKVRVKEDAFLKRSMTVLQKKADDMLRQPPAPYTLVPSKYLLNTARSVLDCSYTLGLVYRLTGDRRYADRLWKELDHAAHFNDWDPDHFLGTAELTHAFAIAYDWLFDVWTNEQKRVIKQAITDRGLASGFLYYHGLSRAFNWAAVTHNWNQVCNGSMAMGALAIADEEPKFCEAILQQALKRIPGAMEHYGPDGGWNEGPVYIAFALKYNVALLACLESALGTDFGLSNIKGFSSTGRFVLAMSGATGRTFNYSDAVPRVITMPELFWLARKFDQPELAAYQQQWTDHRTPVEMLWYTNKFSKTAEPLPLNQYFRSAEVATLRSAWNDSTALFVGFKAGENGVNHGHLDIGSFVLEKNAKRWVVDLAGDSYNLPGYFNGGKKQDAPRYRYYRLSTEGHNTLVVKQGADANQNVSAFVRIDSFSGSGNRPFGLMDMSAAYQPAVKSARRGIAMIDNEQVLVQDELVADHPLDVYWLVHTPALITLSRDKRTALLRIGDEKLEVQILSPAKGRFEILDAQPLLNEPLSTGNGSNEGIRRLAVHLKNAKQERIAIIFRSPSSHPEIQLKALSAW